MLCTFSIKCGRVHLRATIRVVAEGDSHFSRAVFIVVGLLSILISRADSNSVDTVHETICSTRVILIASIPSSPYIDIPLPIPTLAEKRNNKDVN